MTWDIVHRGRKIQVAVDRAAAPDGQTIQRDVVLHPGAVAILPLLDADHVVLLRNHRFILNEVLWEIPAGTLEPGEDPLETARRELAEETGYRAGKLEKLCEFYMSPGILRERMHLFLATQLMAGKDSREPGEEIENLAVPWSEAIGMVESGTIRDAKTLAGLLYYDRFRRESPSAG